MFRSDRFTMIFFSFGAQQRGLYVSAEGADIHTCAEAHIRILSRCTRVA